MPLACHEVVPRADNGPGSGSGEERARLTRYCEKLPAHTAQNRAGSSRTSAALDSALWPAPPCGQGGDGFGWHERSTCIA